MNKTHSSQENFAYPKKNLILCKDRVHKAIHVCDWCLQEVQADCPQPPKIRSQMHEIETKGWETLITGRCLFHQRMRKEHFQFLLSQNF